MLQLSAKTLLKPFNAGMSSTKLALEEDEFDNFDNEVALDNDAKGNIEGDSDEDGDKDGHNGSRED